MKTSSFSLVSDLLLSNNEDEFLNHKKVQLLENITVYGSISKAAKESGITYKTAWSWIDKMNTLAPKPLVQKISGGKDGGGTLVTAYAKELMNTYEEVEALQQKHLRMLEESFLHLQGDEQSQSFTFSRLDAEIKEILIKGDKAIVLLLLACGNEISAQAPLSFIEVNSLSVGSPVNVLIESDTVSVSKSFEKEISSRNKLTVKVKEIDIRGEDVLLTLLLCKDYCLTSRVTYKSYKDLQIKKGDELRAVFKAYSVTLFVR